MPTTIDIYDSLTSDELEQVTNILLEALAREKNISPEVFEIQTNIIMWDFFTQDQWDSILSDIKDPEIVSTIQQLWRSSY